MFLLKMLQCRSLSGFDQQRWQFLFRKIIKGGAFPIVEPKNVFIGINQIFIIRRLIAAPFCPVSFKYTKIRRPSWV